MAWEKTKIEYTWGGVNHGYILQKAFEKNHDNDKE
jgi:hypothetical protein